MKFNALGYGSIALFALIGCSTDATTSTGNAELGIAAFDVVDTATTTTVVGHDADGKEVARLDLIHGRFALTGIFRADYETPEVDGRKLDVALHGTTRLTWETAGYDPVLNMPAHPANQAELAAFLADPHVSAVLDRWQIGFAGAAVASDEVPEGSGSYTGTNYYDCSGQSDCGSFQRPGATQPVTMNTCGAGGPAWAAGRITRSSPDAEYLIEQCCPEGTGGQSSDWFAVKSCPTTSANNYRTTCGNASSSSACKSCPTYPTNSAALCSVSYSGTSLSYMYYPPCSYGSECAQFGNLYCDSVTHTCRDFDPDVSEQCPNGQVCGWQWQAGFCDDMGWGSYACRI